MDAMIRIALTVAAFDAIAATLPPGGVGFEGRPNEKGERIIWLDARTADRLAAVRGEGESYTDVKSHAPTSLSNWLTSIYS
jgi:hypothetical protein